MREVTVGRLPGPVSEPCDSIAARRAVPGMATHKPAASASFAPPSYSTSRRHAHMITMGRTPDTSTRSSLTSGSEPTKLKTSLIARVPLASSRPKETAVSARSSQSLINASCPMSGQMNSHSGDNSNNVLRPQTWSLETRRRRTVTNCPNELTRETNSLLAAKMRSEVPKKGTPSILPRLLTKKQADGANKVEAENKPTPSESQEVKNLRLSSKISAAAAAEAAAAADGQRSLHPSVPANNNKQDLSCGRPNGSAAACTNATSSRVRASKSNGRLSNPVTIVQPKQQRDFSVKQKLVSIGRDQQQHTQKFNTSKISNQTSTSVASSTKAHDTLAANLEANREETSRRTGPETRDELGRGEKRIHGDVNSSQTSMKARDTCENGSTNSQHELVDSTISKYGRPHGGPSSGHEVEAAAVSKQEDDGEEDEAARREAKLVGGSVGGEKKRAPTKTKTSGQERTNATKLRASYSSSSATARRLAFAGAASSLAAPSSLSPAGNKSTANAGGDKSSAVPSRSGSSANNDHCRTNEKHPARQAANNSVRSAQTGRRLSSIRGPLAKQQQQAKSANCYTAHQRPDRNINLQPQAGGHSSHQNKSMRRPTSAADSATVDARKLPTSLQAAHKTNETISHDSETGAINDRLLPKPMGQQVLSLMMLDAGLLPANSGGGGCGGGQPGPMGNDKSHVCLQNESSSMLDDFETGDSHTVASLSRKLADSLRKLSACDRDFDGNNNETFDLPFDPRATTRIDLSKTSFEDASGRFDRQTASISLPGSPRPTRMRVRQNVLANERQRVCNMASETMMAHLHQVQSASSNYERAMARWLSPVRFMSDQCSNSRGAQLAQEVNQELEAHSINSSSCSSLNHHNCPPPPLALSNQLSEFTSQRLFARATDLKDSFERAPPSPAGRERNHQREFDGERVHLTDWVECPIVERRKSDEEASIDERRYNGALWSVEAAASPPNASTHKMDHLPGTIQVDSTNDTTKFVGVSSHNQQAPALLMRDTRPTSSNSPLGAQDSQFDQMRQQQPRSNSIGDPEFGLGGHQRLKHSIYPHQSPYIDSSQYYNQRLRHGGGHSAAADRSLSPMNFEPGRLVQEYNLLPQRSSSIKYSTSDRQQVRNQLHASLECLNIGYSDQVASDQKQLQQSFSHHQSYHQPLQPAAYPYSNNYPVSQLTNQHYAASYVLTPASAETVVSLNGEQDLAAAAMENPAQAHYRRTTPVSSSYNNAPSLPPAPPVNSYQGQSVMSRIQAPQWQSPLHRKISATHNQSATSQHGSANMSSSNAIRAGHSSLSLASSAYLIEDKLQHEIKKLESELKIEKEKNEALNSQLSINSNLMAAFEQSLNTLNNRVRQLSTLNERKDNEIEELRQQLRSGAELDTNSIARPDSSSSALLKERQSDLEEEAKQSHPKAPSESDNNSETELRKLVEDLRRQLIEKDRLLTDTRLEALSAAHQLEQLESRLNRDQSIVVNEDDIDEGVLVVNHSPSDSEVVTDSAHFSAELHTIQMSKTNESQQAQNFYRQSELDTLSHSDISPFGTTRRGKSLTNGSNNTSSLSNSNHSAHSPEDSNEQQQQHFHYHQTTHQDNTSNHSSSDYHGGDDDDRSPADNTNQHAQPTEGARYNAEDSEAMNRLLDIMLVGTN